MHAGAYRANPSRRVYIAKADGRLRPLGIATLEDKLLQRAVAEVLSAIYESDFVGFSYGFRPGRSPHRALDALAVGIERRRVNWVLDADIRDYLEPSSHCLSVAGGAHLQYVALARADLREQRVQRDALLDSGKARLDNGDAFAERGAAVLVVLIRCVRGDCAVGA